MQDGGSAVDGAICAATLLRFRGPHMTALGGDAFVRLAAGWGWLGLAACHPLRR